MDPTITACEIGPYPKSLFDAMPQVKVTFSDGTSKTLFSFYPDEISFTSTEFIGLTERQARELFTRKDTAYLRS